MGSNNPSAKKMRENDKKNAANMMKKGKDAEKAKAPAKKKSGKKKGK